MATPVFDAVSSGSIATGSPTSLTFSHTTTGSNVVLNVSVVTTKTANTDNVTVTYNGVAMTKKVSQLVISNIIVQAEYVLYVGAGVGAANIVISAPAGPDRIFGAGQSFTTCSSTQTGATGSNTSAGTSVTTSLTTTQANSAICSSVWVNGSGENPSGTNGEIQKFDINNGNEVAGGYRTTTTVGSYTTGWSATDAGTITAVEIIGAPDNYTLTVGTATYSLSLKTVIFGQKIIIGTLSVLNSFKNVLMRLRGWVSSSKSSGTWNGSNKSSGSWTSQNKS
jgi:hypothetical protein